MIPNNNLSVLPWYDNISKQNARKWWAYDRVYPLYGSYRPYISRKGTQLPPFQITDAPMSADSDMYYEWLENYAISGLMHTGGNYPYDQSQDGVLLEIPGQVLGDGAVLYFSDFYFVDPDDDIVRFFDQNDNLLQAVSFSELSSGENIWWSIKVPEGTAMAYINITDLAYQDPTDVFNDYSSRVADSIMIPSSAFVYDAQDNYIAELNLSGKLDYIYEGGKTITITYYKDALNWPGGKEGQYYLEMAIGDTTWGSAVYYYSEVFTLVDYVMINNGDYVKIRWWDNEDFVTDGGTIYYQNGFKNEVILQTNIAKPEYIFEEEGETRDGYFFPTKQISEKRYKFNFLASEYLLDVMRFIRMADYIEIECKGETYSADSFLISPEWQDDGDIASVEASFDTATVAKKIGVGYIKSSS